MDDFNEQLEPDPVGAPQGSVTVYFSPRKTACLLDWCATRMGDAVASVNFTAAFGVSLPLARVLNQGEKFSREGVRRSPRIASRIQNDDGLLRYILLDSQPSEHASEKSRESAEKKGRGGEYCDYFDFKKLKSKVSSPLKSESENLVAVVRGQSKKTLGLKWTWRN